MLPLPMLLTAVGLSSFGKHIKVIFLVLLALSAMRYALMVSSYRIAYSPSWQYGYAQTIQFIKDHYDQYDRVIFTKKYGEPHEFVAYYWPWNPADFQKDKRWDYHANWYWINSLDKFIFVNDWEIPQITPTGKTLVISSPENSTPGVELQRIDFLDGQPAFIIKKL